MWKNGYIDRHQFFRMYVELSNPVKYQYVTSASVYSKYAKVSKLAVRDISSQ